MAWLRLLDPTAVYFLISGITIGIYLMSFRRWH